MKMSLLIVAALAFLSGPALAQTATTDPAAPAARSSRAPRATPREPTAGQMAARERQKKCGAEWKTAKASGSTGGQKWPQFWSKCNARLKGNQA